MASTPHEQTLSTKPSFLLILSAIVYTALATIGLYHYWQTYIAGIVIAIVTLICVFFIAISKKSKEGKEKLYFYLILAVIILDCLVFAATLLPHVIWTTG